MMLHYADACTGAVPVVLDLFVFANIVVSRLFKTITIGKPVSSAEYQQIPNGVLVLDQMASGLGITVTHKYILRHDFYSGISNMVRTCTYIHTHIYILDLVLFTRIVELK